MIALLALTVAALAPCVAHGAPTTIPASSPKILWIGRSQTVGSSVFFDWEGVSATVNLQSFSWLAVNISDNCPGSSVGGGSRWLVTMTTSNALTSSPNHRIATFYSGPLSSLYYLFNNPGAHCDPACDFSGTTTFTLTRITESRLSGCIPGANLSVNAFLTDGVFVDPPSMPTRRLEFVGDSITAGDLNDDGQTGRCGNAAFNNDITLSTGGQLCLPTALGGFGAACMYTAWGGIQLGLGTSWGMSKLYPFTFSADGPNAYTPWAFDQFPVDGVVVNLGTNDHPPAPALQWQVEYAAYVTDLVTKYYNNPRLAIFLAYGPMTNYYQPFVTNITATLVQKGINAHTLDLTLPHGMTGCYGHPSAADNVEIAAKAKPQIAAVLGW
eukprot:m.256243 g.256243  ORF g.256243 m.256243 type:complete len:383 (+) comp20092_c0_seq1:55-1203(+)